MIGIVIVANGNIACELLSCAEQILGAQQQSVTAISLNGYYDTRKKQEEICSAVAAVDDGHGVFVVTDMYGSSPANLSLKACNRSDRIILAGANMPMLMKLFKTRHKGLQQAAFEAAACGREYVKVFE